MPALRERDERNTTVDAVLGFWSAETVSVDYDTLVFEPHSCSANANWGAVVSDTPEVAVLVYMESIRWDISEEDLLRKTMLASVKVLREEWDDPEEAEAWAHFQEEA